jgi:hypothetical protein
LPVLLRCLQSGFFLGFQEREGKRAKLIKLAKSN